MTRDEFIDRVDQEYVEAIKDPNDHRYGLEAIVDATLAAVVKVLEAEFRFWDDLPEESGLAMAIATVRALQAPAPEPERAEGERG